MSFEVNILYYSTYNVYNYFLASSMLIVSNSVTLEILLSYRQFSGIYYYLPMDII